MSDASIERVSNEFVNLTVGLDSDNSSSAKHKHMGGCGDECECEPQLNHASESPETVVEKEDDSLSSISRHASNCVSILDFSKKGLNHLPDELLTKLPNIMLLYLEGNQLKILPDTFFEWLPKLQWLDLRRNNLVKLPSKGLCQHQNLRCLLLEGNQLKTLPSELGLVSTLHGLNIANNPLEFPPQDVIQKGAHKVLSFLRNIYFQSQAETDNHADEEDLEDSDTSYYSTSGGAYSSSAGGQSYRIRNSSSANPELIGPVPSSAEIHHPLSYAELKEKHKQKLQKMGAMGTVDENMRLRFKRHRVCCYPGEPPSNHFNAKLSEERRLALIREEKEQEDAILQKQKDAKMLENWRDEMTQVQRMKHMQINIHDLAAETPYAVDEAHLKMLSNEERIKNEVKIAHGKARIFSPESKLRIQQEKSAKIKELEMKIREQALKIHERRKQPRQTVKEELASTKNDLKIAKEFQKELENQKKHLEYRFRAFTTDFISQSRKLPHPPKLEPK